MELLICHSLCMYARGDWALMMAGIPPSDVDPWQKSMSESASNCEEQSCQLGQGWKKTFMTSEDKIHHCRHLLGF